MFLNTTDKNYKFTPKSQETIYNSSEEKFILPKEIVDKPIKTPKPFLKGN